MECDKKECLIHSVDNSQDKDLESRAEKEEGKKFVPVVARVSPVLSVSCCCWFCPIEAMIAPRNLCMQPLELQV